MRLMAHQYVFFPSHSKLIQNYCLLTLMHLPLSKAFRSDMALVCFFRVLSCNLNKPNLTINSHDHPDLNSGIMWKVSFDWHVHDVSELNV